MKRYRWILVYAIAYIALQTLWQLPFYCIISVFMLYQDEIIANVRSDENVSAGLWYFMRIEASLMMTARSAFYSLGALRVWLLH